MLPKTINNTTNFFIVKQERGNMSLTNIVTSRLWAIMFVEKKTPDVQYCVFPLISDI